MTREYYKPNEWDYFDEYNEYIICENVDKIIDNIFDDFESRTCENCINDYQCNIQDKLELQDYSLNFGCTFFRKKETR